MMLMGANSPRGLRRSWPSSRRSEPTLPDGVTIETFYDRTELVDRTIRTVVRRTSSRAALLVVVVLLLLLGNLRGGLLVAAR